MAQLIVRKLPDQIVRRLKQVAADSGVSTEEAHRLILRQALLSDGKGDDRFAPLKNILREMPDIGDDSDFARLSDLPTAPNLP
ncbi:MAG: DNA-binding protein [Verrucomicrobia bacterium]|nr:DNA-binding protein [Verrucomicrobiota bacterium]